MRVLESVRLLGAAMTQDGKIHVHALVTVDRHRIIPWAALTEGTDIHLDTIRIESTDVARELAAALLREADRIESRERDHERTHRGTA